MSVFLICLEEFFVCHQNVLFELDTFAWGGIRSGLILTTRMLKKRLWLGRDRVVTSSLSRHNIDANKALPLAQAHYGSVLLLAVDVMCCHVFWGDKYFKQPIRR